MCSNELATNTITADNRIGSSSAEMPTIAGSRFGTDIGRGIWSPAGRVATWRGANSRVAHYPEGPAEVYPAARCYALSHLPGLLSPLHCSSTQRRRLLLSEDRKSTRLDSSHVEISYAVFCLK